MMIIRALERKDLESIHKIKNEKDTMTYWFEEPYESLDELSGLYDKHIHDSSERRFVVEFEEQFAGIVELVDIDFIHRNCEIQIVIIDQFRGHGLAEKAMEKGINYAFSMLNMHKVYLYVDSLNQKAIHIYEKLGFKIEGTLLQQFYANGQYRDSLFMGIFRETWFK